jgi:hypothetical protein
VTVEEAKRRADTMMQDFKRQIAETLKDRS